MICTGSFRPARNTVSHSVAFAGSATRCHFGGDISQPSSSPDHRMCASWSRSSLARSPAAGSVTRLKFRNAPPLQKATSAAF